MAKKATKLRPWTKEDMRTSQDTCAREDKDDGDRA